MTFDQIQTHAEAATLTGEGLDSYSRRGVAVTRDAASLIMAALHRDAFEMTTRGGEANVAAAEMNKKLARSILESLR